MTQATQQTNEINPKHYVPSFQRPVNDWARRIYRNVDEGKVDLAVNAERLRAHVMLQLPSNIHNLVPDGLDYVKLIDFLKNVGQSGTSLHSVLNSNTHVTEKPSNMFKLKIRELKEVLPAAPADVLNELAWSHIMQSLPNVIKTHVAMIPYKKYPDDDQLELIDRAIEQQQTTSSFAANASSTTHANAVTLDHSKERMDRIEQKLDKLIDCLSNVATNTCNKPNQFKTKQNPRTFQPTYENLNEYSYRHHNFNQSKYPQNFQSKTMNCPFPRNIRPASGQSPWAPDSQGIKQVCYYHRKFGQNARRCVEPCLFKDHPNAFLGHGAPSQK